MKLSLPPTFLLLCGGAVLIVVTFMIVALWLWFSDKRPLLVAGDANMVSIQMMELYKKKPVPAQAEIDEQIRDLIRASVIGGSLDSGGQPLDRYGTPYRVRHTVDGAVHTSTATSAGPDRVFDTPDDLSRSATWDRR